MNDESTVIYYTGHREKPDFESRIQQTMLTAMNGMRLISVSQKPIKFGQNICVGDVGTSAHNAWRQLQIGVEQATTPFIHVAESDFLYPAKYFQFIPPCCDRFYAPTPMYVLTVQAQRRHGFQMKKNVSEGTLVVGREFLLKRLGKMFAGRPQWEANKPEYEAEKSLRRHLRVHAPPPIRLLNRDDVVRFPTDVPTVSFKTDENLHYFTPVARGMCYHIPHYPRASRLIRQYLEVADATDLNG